MSHVRIVFALSPLVAATLLAQAALQPRRRAPPTLEEVRKAMGIPSAGDVRGQQDAVGFASTAEQMAQGLGALGDAARARSGSASPRRPDVAGVICPHDDYLYAGRVYRQVLPLVTAKTVVLVGVFHKYRRFGAHDVLVFDGYRAWRTPDGDVPVSRAARASCSRGCPHGDCRPGRRRPRLASTRSRRCVYWLRHVRPDVEIVPVIVPAMGFDAHAGAGRRPRRRPRRGDDERTAGSSDATSRS